MTALPSRKRPHPPDVNSGDGGDSGSNVKVVVRIRPQNVKEVEGNFRVVVQAVDENILVFDPKENSAEYGGIKGRRDIRKRPNRDLKFAFDRVFGPDAQNAEIYKETTNSVISGVLNGYNCSVFAYGATGAGKTFTMLGTKDQPGVMYHTMEDLYSRIESVKDSSTCNVAVSYLEVYNETIRDLLMPGNPLPIREDPGKGVVIPGLSLHKPQNAEELLYMLQFGNQHRSQHPTDANAESSRSHAVFQVFVRQQDRTANISTEVRVAKMCLVDLAGSERATVTKNRGSRFREGANINRSLLALGNVINALAENKNKGFVPYRDSKLTRLLKDSLGGNCQTVMIAAVSPSAMSFEDTYNTLRYADRAKNIKATLKKNVLNVDFHMAKYGQIVTELRKEISELKSKLKSYEEGSLTPVHIPAGPDMSSFIGFQSEFDKFFTSHLAMRSDQLQQEIALRNLQWKCYRKNRCIARVKAINNTQSQDRLETVVKGMTQKSSCMTVSTEISRGKLEENLACFYDLESRLNETAGGDAIPEVLSLSIEAQKCKLELQDTKQSLSFTKQVIRCQERELVHNERLVIQLLKLLRNQHFILKGHNFLTSDLAEEFKDIEKKVEGQELTWEDEQGDVDPPRTYNLSDMLDLPTLKLKLSSADLKSRKILTNNKHQNERDKKQSVWTSQQPTAKQLPYNQVDECSPPKAKRAMLTHPSVQQPVRNEPGKYRRNLYNATSNRHRPVRKGRFRSFSESNLKRNPIDCAIKGVKATVNCPVNMPLRVLQSNDDSKDSSPDCDEVPVKSRFTKINDTITKAKKFSNLHTKSVTNKTANTQTRATTETEENLDVTFTIDSDQDLPVSLPSINMENVPVCSVCTHSEKLTTTQLNSHSNSVGDNCMKCDTQRKNYGKQINNHPEIVTSVLNTTFDMEELKSGGCVENDSNASTLVNQSASSLASTSTLVDNLSQNLSNTSDNDSVRENPSFQSMSEKSEPPLKVELETAQPLCNSSCDIVVQDSIVSTQSGENIVNGINVKVPNRSATVTKSKRSLDKIADSVNIEKNLKDTKEGSKKTARCIDFGNLGDKGGGTTLAICHTKTPDRRPLQKMGDSNTPQTDRDSFGSSSSNTDSDLSFDKSRNKQNMSATRLFDKENCKILSKLGLPLLSDLSEGRLISNNKSKPRKTQPSATPGYMQSTKAHNHRIKHNKSLISDGDKVDSGPGRVRTSIQNQKPLLSSMRSKSMSNLSRSGWQF